MNGSPWADGRCDSPVIARGLSYEIDINPDDPHAVGVLARVPRGDVTGSSCAFSVHEDDDSGSTPISDAIRCGLFIALRPWANCVLGHLLVRYLIIEN